MILTTFRLISEKQQQLIRVDETINKWLGRKHDFSGLCLFFVSHTTAGICATNKKDADTALDIITDVDRLIPTRVDFKHRWDTPRDAAGHVKTALIGVELVCPVVNSELVIGKSQGIFFYEFDGPRKREFKVVLIQDSVTEISTEQLFQAS
jgi:secondary thiamine-phosphate synthase enzyme